MHFMLQYFKDFIMEETLKNDCFIKLSIQSNIDSKCIQCSSSTFINSDLILTKFGLWVEWIWMLKFTTVEAVYYDHFGSD